MQLEVRDNTVKRSTHRRTIRGKTWRFSQGFTAEGTAELELEDRSPLFPFGLQLTFSNTGVFFPDGQGF